MKSSDSVISRSYWKQFLFAYITVRSYWTLLWSKNWKHSRYFQQQSFGLLLGSTRKQSNVPNCIRKIKRFFSIVFVFWTLLNLTDMVSLAHPESMGAADPVIYFLTSTPKAMWKCTFFVLFWHPHVEPWMPNNKLFLFILDQPIWQHSCQYFGV